MDLAELSPCPQYARRSDRRPALARSRPLSTIISHRFDMRGYASNCARVLVNSGFSDPLPRTSIDRRFSADHGDDRISAAGPV